MPCWNTMRSYIREERASSVFWFKGPVVTAGKSMQRGRLDAAGYITPMIKKQRTTDTCLCSTCFPPFIHYGIPIQMMLHPTEGGASYFNNPMEKACHRRPRSFPKEFYASSGWQLRLIITLPHRTLTPSRLPSVWRDSTISGSFTLKTFQSPWILILCLPTLHLRF